MELTLGERMKQKIVCENWKEGDIEIWEAKQHPDNKKYQVRKQQLDFMIKHGLKPHHKLLDIGCGYLRGGVLFIEYLNKDNYYAFDKEPWLLKCGMGGVQKLDILKKNPDIRLIENFEIDEFNTHFDFMIAQSVFSHITKELIDVCIRNVTKWLKPNGKFLATFFEGDYGIGNIHLYRKEEFARVNTNIELYKKICDKHNCDVSYEGEFGHISGQKLLCITKREGAI